MDPKHVRSIALAGLIVVCLGTAASPSLASGLLVPRGGGNPLEIVSHVVDATIDDQIARTRVTQVFRNPSNRTLEATYLFTLPEGAAASDFAMWTGGQRRRAVLASREEARRIYESVVATRRDPGLVEQLGPRTFRMRVFPILPGADQKVELVYDQKLAIENGTCRYEYPLRTDRAPASQVKRDFTLNVHVRSAVPIETVYSPTHDVMTSRRGPGDVIVGFEQQCATLDKDLLLYYKPKFDKLGFRVVAEKRPSQAGSFLTLVTPGIMNARTTYPKDILLLLDTSGSMKGEKIELAREAMRFFVNSLGAGDRFNILTFSNDVRAFRPGFVGLDRETRAAAHGFIESIQAGGGTAIDDALARALADIAASGGDARPKRVLFVTDGEPTVGERDAKTIIKNAMARNSAGARIFSFGIETNIDAALLNQLAAKTGGSADLVAPGDDLEVRVSEFVARYSRPVLTDIRVTVDGVGAYDIYPKKPSDLFEGGQVAIVGRYHQPGTAVVRVAGNYLGQPIEFVEEFKLPAATQGEAPIARLWAREKIAFLTDEIWWRGNAKELESEIVRLSCEHSILTPYTAMLLLETEADYRRHGLEPPREALDIVAKAREAGAGSFDVNGERLRYEAAGQPALSAGVYLSDSLAFDGRISNDAFVGAVSRSRSGNATAPSRGVNATGSPGFSATAGRPTTLSAEHDESPATHRRDDTRARLRELGYVQPDSGRKEARRVSSERVVDAGDAWLLERKNAGGGSPADQGRAKHASNDPAPSKKDPPRLAPFESALRVQWLLAGGSTHTAGPYARHVKSDLAVLLAQPLPNASDRLTYEQLEIALAMVSAFRATQSPLYRTAAEAYLAASANTLSGGKISLTHVALAALTASEGYHAGLVDPAAWQKAVSNARTLLATVPDVVKTTAGASDWAARAEAAAGVAALARIDAEAARPLVVTLASIEIPAGRTAADAAPIARFGRFVKLAASRTGTDFALPAAPDGLAARDALHWSLGR